MTQQEKEEKGSFRDRRSQVFHINGEVFRYLDGPAFEEWSFFRKSDVYAKLKDQGSIVATEEIGPNESAFRNKPAKWAAVLKHETIPFISYPYEWSPRQLKDAATLHLDILLDTLQEDIILKDSSAYNIQWSGCCPVFIDIASFERLKRGETWTGYKQFCEMFLNPLVLLAYKKIDFRPLMRGRIDGIDTRQAASIFSVFDLFRSGVFTHVFLHDKLQKSKPVSKLSKASIAGEASLKNIIVSNVRSLRRIVERLDVDCPVTHWSQYAGDNSYDAQEHQLKRGFIEGVCQTNQYGHVWDLGSNTGEYSIIASQYCGHVVAFDSDGGCVSSLYERCKVDGIANILPLHLDLADPSPSQGWRGMERRSLDERGKPDLVISLALIHHMVIGRNIPLGGFISWLAGLEADIVLEFVSKSDEMVRALLKNKDDIYDDYSEERLEESLELYFRIEKTVSLKGNERKLYYARNKRNHG